MNLENIKSLARTIFLGTVLKSIKVLLFIAAIVGLVKLSGIELTLLIKI